VKHPETINEASSSARSGVPRTSAPSCPSWARLTATFFGLGYLKPGPGTWGSLTTVLLWALVSSRLANDMRVWATLGAAMVVTAIGIPAATFTARAYAQKDPQFVVIDEVAGQLVALVAVPLAWKTFLAGFILFRIFDMWKPFPIRRLERLPEGTGIVVDDLAAGVYALVIMHLLLHFGLLKV
jgi:phosphatidylglycerophosphatase A